MTTAVQSQSAAASAAISSMRPLPTLAWGAEGLQALASAEASQLHGRTLQQLNSGPNQQPNQNVAAAGGMAIIGEWSPLK